LNIAAASEQPYATNQVVPKHGCAAWRVVKAVWTVNCSSLRL